MTDALETDPDAIEQDIRRTQEDMSRTIDKIGDQLTPRNIFNALLDKADENDVDARMLLDGARRNPMALGLIAAGAIWLVSDKDATFPSVPSSRRGREPRTDDLDPHHRDYVNHMSSVEMRDGEDELAYQRRRDTARANYLMVERRHDEDDSGFRQRLDHLTDKFREKRRAFTESSGQVWNASGRGARQSTAKVQNLFESNPLAGGLIAAAIGAAVGSALPLSRAEQEKLGELGEQARTLASEQKESLANTLREKKDEMVDRAESRLQQGTRDQTGQSPDPQTVAQSSQAPGTADQPQPGRPFPELPL